MVASVLVLFGDPLSPAQRVMGLVGFGLYALALFSMTDRDHWFRVAWVISLVGVGTTVLANTPAVPYLGLWAGYLFMYNLAQIGVAVAVTVGIHRSAVDHPAVRRSAGVALWLVAGTGALLIMALLEPLPRTPIGALVIAANAWFAVVVWLGRDLFGPARGNAAVSA